MHFSIIIVLAFVLSFNSFGQLTINEYLSSAYTGLADEDSEFSDWFEIFNNSDNSVDLTGYSVTDDKSVVNKWIFPSVNIDPYNYLLIFASGKDRKDIFSSEQHFHTNFKISSNGEGLYLFDSFGSLVDSITPVSLPANISYGRKPDGASQWYYFGEPTPGAADSTQGADEIHLDSVYFSIQGGIHIGGCNLELSSNSSEDSIYYTTDGSDPEKDDYYYTGPITISTSIVIRARVISNNPVPNPITTNTYVTEINHEFPVVCISTDPKNLWDEYEGIFVPGFPDYVDSMPYWGANYWEEWEKLVHFEYYDKGGVKQIDQLAGMKVYGGFSRTYEQKSVAMFARKEYGKGSFDYKFFDNKPIEKFENLVLRNGGNDNPFLRFQDEFITNLTDELNIDYRGYQPSAVYLNGEYWGILNIREKVNEQYIAENHNVDANTVNLLEFDGNIISGSNERYLAMLDFLNIHLTLSDNTDYNWIANQIELDNYIQYQLTEIYIDNGDWPGNNIKFWNTNSPGSKWRWILIDTDFGFGLYGENYAINTLEVALEPNGPDWPNPEWSTRLLRRMISNNGFRDNFINQYADRINTNFQPSVVNSKLDSFKNLFNNEIQYHIDLWGGTYENWLSIIDQRKIFGELRPYYARNHIQEYFNLEEQLNVKIEVSSSLNGKVKINSVVPKNYPFDGIYFKDIPISMTAIPNPGYKFIRWEGTVNSTDQTIVYNMSQSGTFKAVFDVSFVEDIIITINEINYNSSSLYASKDWIEIVNNGITSVDLTNWLLSDSGIDSGFVFPAGTIVNPNNYLVIYSDLDKFKTVHPDVTDICGPLPFGLSSSGDKIMLYNKDRILIDFVEYGTLAPWDATANGTGATLELLNPGYDNNLAANWKAGILGGTPGSENLWVETSNLIPAISNNNIDFECFPNPFRDYTTIHFNVKDEGECKLEVFDITGALVNVLSEQFLGQGSYYFDWNGYGKNGKKLPAGIYTVRLSNNNQINNLKIVYLE